MIEPRELHDWEQDARALPSRHAALGAYPIRYDSRLVEEAVFRTIDRLPPEPRRRFHQEREAIYEVADPDVRESRFQQLHGEWFAATGLGAPLESTLSERIALTSATEGCLVIPARICAEEMADLYDRRTSERSDDRNAAVDRNFPKLLVVRVRPETLVHAQGLASLLQHELMHVSDMLDADFRYEQEIPASDAGPSYDNILRDRYRVVWDACIDGRLSRQHLVAEDVRNVRLREFTRAFPMLGARAEQNFARWFDDPRPTHTAIVAFILEPRAAGDNEAQAFDGRCPICRFPSASLDPNPERLSDGAVAALQRDYPAWTRRVGLCLQCGDLYEARRALGENGTAQDHSGSRP